MAKLLSLRLGSISISTTPIPIHAIVFDMDGTLTQPVLDFALMKRRLSLPPTADIVHYLHSLPPNSPQRTQAETIVRDMEHAAMLAMTPARGYLPLLSRLHLARIPKAILTRNNLDPVHHLLTHHLPSACGTFHPVITRDCVQPSKPAPDPLLHILRHHWQLDHSPRTVLMVGDGIDDMLCAHAAGTLSCWIHTTHNVGHLDKLKHDHGLVPDLAVQGLDDLLALLHVGDVPLAEWEPENA